jgi:DNA-binding response OmpR family regulator
MVSDKRLGTILVADDDPDIRKFAKIFLESAGWSVITASDGEEALQFYSAHQSVIVLLLTDVTMPKVNGHELADRVLGIDSHLPVLLMSGVQSGYRGLECLAKPFHPAELVDKVSQTLGARPHSATNGQAAKTISA